MIRSVKRLRHYRIQATDGELGGVEDFYLDDHRWGIRHLVVDTRQWLPGRQILIPPLAVRRVEPARRKLHVGLTKAQVENSPRIDTSKPVSRQHHIELYRYYGFPFEWHSPPLPEAPGTSQQDPHLRSARAVTGYHVHAVDGEIGHVSDFLLDDDRWIIRYLIVDTRNWWPGEKVLVSPGWVTWVSWGEAAVHVDLHRDTVRNAPQFAPRRPIDRDYEVRLFEHYGRPTYWAPDDMGRGATR
jgi:hypothetical protein